MKSLKVLLLAVLVVSLVGILALADSQPSNHSSKAGVDPYLDFNCGGDLDFEAADLAKIADPKCADRFKTHQVCCDLATNSNLTISYYVSPYTMSGGYTMETYLVYYHKSDNGNWDGNGTVDVTAAFSGSIYLVRGKDFDFTMKGCANFELQRNGLKDHSGSYTAKLNITVYY